MKQRYNLEGCEIVQSRDGGGVASGFITEYGEKLEAL